MELDSKDKQILGQLELDAMQSYSDIAKKVRLSKEVVRYRIEKMVDLRLIEQFVFMVNTKLFGYTPYKLYIQLENTDERKQKEILRYFKSHPFCVWLVTCSGRFDMVAALFAKSPEEFNKMMNEFVARHARYIRDTTASMMISVSHYKRKYLTCGINEQIPEINGTTMITLDPEEIHVLSSMSTNARKSFTEVAQETRLSPDVVRYRIKKMKENGIIQGSRLGINKELLGFEYHKLLLKLKDMTSQNEKMLIEFFSQNTNIVDVVQTFGEWDMEIDVDVQNSFELHKLIMNLKNRFPTMIRRYESLQIFKEHHYNFFPMGQHLLEQNKKSR